MADKSAILNRVAEAKMTFENELYLAAFSLSGDSTYSPCEVANNMKGDKDAIAQLRLASSLAEVATLVHSLVLRLKSAEQRIAELSRIGGNSK
jgi:hypothetical protein